jgi:GT2 family glycosyltransferase
MSETSTNPKVSIIIPSWFAPSQDGKYGIDETFKVAAICLDRLLKHTPTGLCQLILIDNGSSRVLDDKLRWYWESANILIKNETNLGFGPAVNQGITAADTEFIIQMNNDILVFDGWLEAILEAFDHIELKPPVGIVMPNLVKKEYQKDCLDERGKLDFYKVLALPKEKLVLRNYGVYEPGAEFGSCWCLKKELADKLIAKDGFFFDPQFLMMFKEDRDLYKRVRLFGYETYRTNKTRVLHVGNLSVNKLENHKQISLENRKRFNRKWNIIDPVS